MTPPEGKALVYIVRSKKAGFLIKFHVYFNENYIGATKGKNFLYAIVDPGHYVVLSKSFENKHEIEIDVEAGKTYFILQKVRVGVVAARVKMYLTDEVEGRTRLNKCKFSKILPEE